jgi:dipeptidyl aminopeptidase/acylaminoacyl peptidase
MSLRHLLRVPALGGLLCSLTAVALAQPPGDSARPATGGAGNRFATLPYGARDEKPASRWTPPPSAGRQLTLNDLLTWKQIRNPVLSNDGKWFAYILGPNEGDAEVVIRGTAAESKEARFPVGDAAALNRGAGPPPGGPGGSGAAGASALLLSGNSRWAAFLVYPSSAASRARRPAGSASSATPPTRLAVVNLATGAKREFENVRAYRFAGDRSDWIAIHHGAPAGAAPGAPGAGAAGGSPPASPAGTVLELVNLAGGTPIPIANVSEFAFDDSGDWIAFAVSVADQLGNGLQLRQLSTGLTRSLDAQKASYRRIAWADSSTALAALRVVTDTSAQSPNEEQVTALLWPAAPTAGTIEIDQRTPGLPAGLVLSADYPISFGRTAKLVFLGLREPRPPRPRAPGGGSTPPNPGGVAPGAGNTGQVAAAPQTDPDVPSLILWHWKDSRTQATQQVQETADRSFAYVASYDVAAGRLARLTDDKARSLQRGPRDIWGILSDASAYEREAGIRGFAYRDLYAVNLATGDRRLIQAKVPGSPGGGFAGGGGAQPFAPDDSKYAYYDTGDWKVYDFARGTLRTITEGVPGKFWDTEDDHNQVKPPIPGGLLGWSRDGSSVIVRDNWDLWRLPVGPGAAINLTGNGAKDQVRYQNRLVFDSRDRRGIDLATPLYVETFEEWTKREGLVQVDPLKGGVRRLALENAKVDYRRARDATVWLYTRQTVVTFPDFYAADEGLRNERRLTDANPQQKEVAWTPGAMLVDYACDNGGGRHQAVLYLPAGYEKGKTYPTLTYIYELLSQEYNVYSQPNATRYANPSVFTSRGYAFLKPDIVYHVNDPGRSALWCIVPAVKAAIATGVVDPNRVGLQGHSWGGYQTAFVTTQTDVFRTAVAGAPLTDMVSMFGSIYWNTGNTDGSIFIASQGRFTGGPNEIPEAYRRNSPQTFADKLSIPLMILHNDRDGAVDFNQGITYYNHLRQLGKEVVLLEYVGENHGLSRPANQKDYALRMTEWFDTFLRDQPAPPWLEEGIPRLAMEAHLRERRPMLDARAEPERPRPIP